ncbi:GGDEF domain-containing protein [Pseudoalteromonas ruthenica]|uniref:diguanylate cyclase n=1 Tax=Pseudoalteromonas ruthenica TaxID=151081 RepID=A0A5S3Z3R5_9GAMM|nr:diguanylate cyclase [Pseudoalteromonas ruthenica]TMP86868.1 GGDEF domain-containing protein [Pseudoalteromonas ruthenica]
MRFNPFRTHPLLAHISIAWLVLAALLSYQLGELKYSGDIAWLDILGEGGIVLMTLSWIVALLVSRPPGKVTTLLVLGLGLFMFSASLDLLDEWLHQPSRYWLSWIESLPAPVGMLFTSAGLYWWHQEQFVLNRQLARREAHMRDHQKVCPVTGLYRIQYVQKVFDSSRESKTKCCIAMIDVENFAAVNARFGLATGDRLLRELSDLMVMNIRMGDILSRYASDSFILLLPATTSRQAQQLIAQLQSAIRHCAFRLAPQGQAHYINTYSAVIETAKDEPLPQLLRQLQQQLQQQKHRPGQGDATLCSSR